MLGGKISNQDEDEVEDELRLLEGEVSCGHVSFNSSRPAYCCAGVW